MICIGVLSVQKDKPKQTYRFLNPIKSARKHQTQIMVTAAEYMLSEKEISRLPKVCKAALLRRGRRILKANGAQKIFYTDLCKKVFGITENESCGNNNGLSADEVRSAAEFAVRRVGKDALGATLILADGDLSAVSYDFLRDICTSVGNIKILTKNTAKAEKIADRLYGEYGVCTDISSNTESSFLTSGILCDFDKGTVVMPGGIIIDGTEEELDLCGYEVDKEEILYYLKENGVKLKLKYLLSGKKRLTI